MSVHVLARTASIRRPALDVLVERVARSLLAWSDRRVVRRQVSHERMALLRANERAASRGGSTFGR